MKKPVLRVLGLLLIAGALWTAAPASQAGASPICICPPCVAGSICCARLGANGQCVTFCFHGHICPG